MQYVSHSSVALDRGAMVAGGLAPDLQGIQVAVVGRGRSGVAAVRFLAHRSHGAKLRSFAAVIPS